MKTSTSGLQKNEEETKSYILKNYVLTIILIFLSRFKFSPTLHPP